VLSGQVERALKYWLGNDDGKAGQRVKDYILIEITGTNLSQARLS
jgi:hypothetical protein